MKILQTLQDWGFTSETWRGRKGEYWFLGQVILIIGLTIVPIYRPDWLRIDSPIAIYLTWAIASGLAVGALMLIGKGLLDLGQNLTPLPYPKEDGQLVQTGIYGVVRHPLYSGLILAAASYSIWQLSLSHLALGAVLFAFLDAKASREEAWLSQKHLEYVDYRQRVKKLIPWIY